MSNRSLDADGDGNVTHRPFAGHPVFPVGPDVSRRDTLPSALFVGWMSHRLECNRLRGSRGGAGDFSISFFWGELAGFAPRGFAKGMASAIPTCHLTCCTPRVI